LEDRVDIKLNDAEHSVSIWLPADQAIQRATSPTNKQAIETVLPGEQYRAKPIF